MTHPQFTPALHPRYPAGHMLGGVNVGGKFMPKNTQGSALWAQQVSAALARAGAGPATPVATPKPAKPAKNPATRLLGPAPSWRQNFTAGISYFSHGVQTMKNGRLRSVNQWYVDDPQGNQHGPFGTRAAADTYYAKLTGTHVAPPKATAVPATLPSGVNVYTTRVPKTAASGVTRNVTQYWFDYQGQNYGPYASAATRDKQIATATKPPHPVAKGKDLIGLPPNQHPNRLAKKVAAARPSDATRSGYVGSGTSGSGAYRSPRAADVDLATIADLQGFSGKPESVTKSEMSGLAKGGSHYILYRGVSSTASSGWRHKNTGGSAKTAKQIQDELRDGDAYYGVGVYGNGYYFSTDRMTAVGYSDRTTGSVVRAALPKYAKIGQYNALAAEVQKLMGHPAASLDNREVFADVGRYAASRGYDALVVGGYGYYVVLNRSILKVQDS